MTKLIFMGTPDFSATVLQGLLSHPDYEVVAVVTQPDRAVGRKKTVQMSPVKQLAVAHGLPVYQPQKLAASSELQELLALEVDGIVTAAFGQFLPTVLLDAVGFAVNVHASLLPKYRGGAPIHYALINGDKETGVTIMEMVKEMDAGDMIAAGRLPIEEADTVATLFDKLAVLGRDVLLECLPAYLSGELLPQPQDSSQVSYSPAIRPEEEVLDWSRPAMALFNQIRGMYPWPVAHTYWQGERFKIQGSCLAAGEGEPGQVLLVSKKELVIACGQGALSLKQVQPAGKPQMAIEAFLNGAGRSIEQGDQFGTEERNS